MYSNESTLKTSTVTAEKELGVGVGWRWGGDGVAMELKEISEGREGEGGLSRKEGGGVERAGKTVSGIKALFGLLGCGWRLCEL